MSAAGGVEQDCVFVQLLMYRRKRPSTQRYLRRARIVLGAMLFTTEPALWVVLSDRRCYYPVTSLSA